MRAIPAILLSALLIAGVGLCGYVFGQAGAPDESEARSEYTAAFRVAFAKEANRARERSVARGARRGRLVGVEKGRVQGGGSGAKAGSDAAVEEHDRIEQERIEAEAAAALAAELAIPEPCRGMPDSTARRMCIGAVESGTYP